MERIVVGVDAGPASRAALEWVAARCARRPGRVEIVHVVWDAIAGGRASQALLDDADALIRAKAPDQQVRSHRAGGRVARTLADLAAAADLLVIGIDPAHPLRAAFGGWLPLRVAARALPPVCVVPAGWNERVGEVIVGAAADGSSDHALTVAATEAAAAGVRLHIIHAWQLPGPVIDGAVAFHTQPAELLHVHRQVLEDAAAAARREVPLVRIESELVRAEAAEALSRASRRSALTVIGTHRSGVLAGGFYGSVAQNILWRTDCPVLIVPAALTTA